MSQLLPAAGEGLRLGLDVEDRPAGSVILLSPHRRSTALTKEAGTGAEEGLTQGLGVPADMNWPRSPANLGQKATRVPELWTRKAVQNAVKGRKASQARAQSHLWCHPNHSPQNPRHGVYFFTDLCCHCRHHTCHRHR